MKKLLLVQPKSPETHWKMSGLVGRFNKALMPPLSLATIAALTPKQYEIQIVDEDVDSIDFDVPCDLVGITGYTVHSERMFQIAAEFRKRNILTVAGGSFVSSHMKECVNHFDVLICGEAEKVWPQFLLDWEKGKYQEYYEGEKDLDLSISPVPRWDLLDLKRYDTMMVQTSRGCPYDCEFCDVVSLFGHRMRCKPLENIMKEIQLLEKLSKNRIFLADDNLIGNKGFVTELLTRLIEFNHELSGPLQYMTQVTLNVAQDETLLDLFKEANFFSIFIGIETPNKKSLVETNKIMNLRLDMTEAVERIQSRGIFIMSGLVVGFDSDDLSTFDLQTEFLIEAGLIAPMPVLLSAPNGTKLWERLNREGRLLNSKLDSAASSYTSNFTPKNMTREELDDNYLAMFRNISSYPHFLKSFATLINQIDTSKTNKNSPLTLQNRTRYLLNDILGICFIVMHFFIKGNKESRTFILTIFKVALRKGFRGLYLVANTLVLFIAQIAFLKVMEDRKISESIPKAA